MKYRPLSTKNKYYLPKEEYLTVIHYSLCYPEWVAEINALRDTRGAIRYDKDKVQTSNNYDSTSETALRTLRIVNKVETIDTIIDEVAKEYGLSDWLRLGVCYGKTVFELINKGMPCGKDLFLKIRQEYYYKLSSQIH